MSMYAYVGLPRSGKSYNVVANVIVPALREGRKVVSNVPVYIEKIRAKLEVEKPGSEVGEFVEFPVAEVAQDPEQIAKYVTPGCVFVLDEVWRLWPAGDKANKVPDVYKSIIAEHGHRVDAQGNSIHIVLVVQDLGNIGMFARRLVEQTFIHTKLGHMGTPNRFRVDIYHGNVTGTTGPKDRRIREMFGKYDKAIWDLYKSHTMSEAKADGANEKAIDKRGNVLKQPIFIIVIPLMLIAGGFAIWKLTQSVGEMTHKKKPEAVAAVGGERQFAGAHPVETIDHKSPIANVVEAKGPAYRLVGWLEVPEHPDRSFAVLVDGKNIVKRGLAHCRTVDTDFKECEVGGRFYGTAGETQYKGNSDAAVPVVPPPKMARNLPLPPATADQASVASADPGIAEESDYSREHHLTDGAPGRTASRGRDMSR